MQAERVGHASSTLKLFALSAALTALALTAYVMVVLSTEDAAGENDELAAFVVIGAIWLVALAVLAIRATESAIWVGFGAGAGLVLSPVIVLIMLLITWALFRWPVLMN